MAGFNEISSYLLEKYVPYMIKPLLELATASIREGISPFTLKKSVVKQFIKRKKRRCLVIIQLYLSQLCQSFRRKKCQMS
jgi:hypothetical protein